VQCRILLVEDDPANRETMALLLRQAGYRVDTAVDGAEALAHLAHGTLPCVIVLDLNMPRVDGWEVLRRRLGDPTLAAVPVVILSALGEAYHGELAALGVQDVLQKPAAPEDLLAALRQY
jgi:CheY-like chemotaxis protein